MYTMAEAQRTEAVKYKNATDAAWAEVKKARTNFATACYDVAVATDAVAQAEAAEIEAGRRVTAANDALTAAHKSYQKALSAENVAFRSATRSPVPE